MPEEFKNLHLIINESTFQKEEEEKMVPATFKVEEGTKEAAEQIIRNHGLTPSHFLRNVYRQLVKEYKQ